MPGAAERGTLIDVGLDFRQLGRLTGYLAADVLAGANPATIPVRDVLDEVPRRLVVNTEAARGLREVWTIPPDVLATATVVVDGTGVHERVPKRAAPAPLGKTWRIDLVQFNQVLDVEEAEEGVRAGVDCELHVGGIRVELEVHGARRVLGLPRELLALDE